METDFLIVTAEEAGQRLDKILAARFNQKSRSYFHSLLEQQKVLLNGEPVKKRIQPKEGDAIEIQWICLPELSLAPEAIPLDVVYEDDFLVVVNKPAGMVVHPAAGNWSGTFVNALLHHCQQIHSLISQGQSSFRPGIVHRLDKDTSGLLIAAKTTETHERLSRLFLNRDIEKEYLALCVGNPGALTIQLPIGRHPHFYQRMTVLPHGKPAITHCKTLISKEMFSLVSLKLVTGRTHQIRVHLQAKGFPILGDPIYGNPKLNATHDVHRQMLHARFLRFKHPMTSEMVAFEAPLPNDMQALINRLLSKDFFQNSIWL